jgi:hypothetical protein
MLQSSCYMMALFFHYFQSIYFICIKVFAKQCLRDTALLLLMSLVCCCENRWLLISSLSELNLIVGKKWNELTYIVLETVCLIMTWSRYECCNVVTIWRHCFFHYFQSIYFVYMEVFAKQCLMDTALLLLMSLVCCCENR